MATNALAPDSVATNALAPANSNSNPYIESLLKKAAKDYPFIQQHNPAVIMGTGQGYAETWPVNETGAPEALRPTTLPIDRLGIEVRRPDAFTHHDLAGEVLHIDPFANETRDKLLKSWSPKQLEALKQQSRDYQATLDEGGRTEADALQNATDSAMRGAVLQQWPVESNKAMMYSPDQQQMLQQLTDYMRGTK